MTSPGSQKFHFIYSLHFSPVERMLRKIGTSVKIFSVIGAVMGLALILLAIVREDAFCKLLQHV